MNAHEDDVTKAFLITNWHSIDKILSLAYALSLSVVIKVKLMVGIYQTVSDSMSM